MGRINSKVEANQEDAVCWYQGTAEVIESVPAHADGFPADLRFGFGAGRSQNRQPKRANHISQNVP